MWHTLQTLTRDLSRIIRPGYVLLCVIACVAGLSGGFGERRESWGEEGEGRGEKG